MNQDCFGLYPVYGWLQSHNSGITCDIYVLFSIIRKQNTSLARVFSLVETKILTMQIVS